MLLFLDRGLAHTMTALSVFVPHKGLADGKAGANATWAAGHYNCTL